MSRYLFTILPTDDLGLLTRSLPIARELQTQGHQVVFCHPAKAPQMLISQAGFENLLPSRPLYRLVGGHLSFGNLARLLCSRYWKQDAELMISHVRHMQRAGTAEFWDFEHFLYAAEMTNQPYVRVIVDALIEIISAVKPDAIVDFFNPFACVAARSCRKPLVAVMQADQHPLSKGFIWWRPAPPGVPRCPALAANAILVDHQAAPVPTIGELCAGDMTLVLGLPETDPLPPEATVTYVGPVLWQRRDEPLPAQLADLDPERPVIWLYPGKLRYLPGGRTAFDSAVVLEACIEALGNQAVQVVLTLGHHSLPRRYSPLPPNFRFEPYVPGLAMAERSDLLIHHGGYGSCQTGLYAGRPALIIPTFSERESNARRIAAVGAGDYVLPSSDATGREKHVSADEVRTKVFRILSDSSFSENAMRLRERMKTFGGASEAARLIERFVGERVASQCRHSSQIPAGPSPG